jgi:hypothetical protein
MHVQQGDQKPMMSHFSWDEPQTLMHWHIWFPSSKVGQPRGNRSCKILSLLFPLVNESERLKPRQSVKLPH